jgi:hypothetical protein
MLVEEIEMRQRVSLFTMTLVVLPTMLAGIVVAYPLRAEDSNALIGNWKLISWQVVAGNDAQDLFGAHPKGYLILSPEGRAMVITTAENRNPGTDEADRAALQKTMLAYTGKYRIEGGDFITTVDVSWNESWNGTEQRRHYRIEGDKLFIESAPAPSILFPGRTDFRRIVWEREK